MVDKYSSVILMGNTIRLKNTITDLDGQPYTPDTLQIKIYDGEKTLVETIETADIEIEGTGVYYVDYVIEDSDKKPGTWKAVWLINKDDKPNADYIEFEVIKVV